MPIFCVQIANDAFVELIVGENALHICMIIMKLILEQIRQ